MAVVVFSEGARGSPVLEVALSGGIRDADFCGDTQGLGRIEFVGETIKQQLLAGAAFGRGFAQVLAGELAPDTEGVANEDGGYGHGGAIVFFLADERFRELSGIHKADGGEDEGDAEGNQAKTADGWDDIITE